MALHLKTAPAIEPLSLSEVKAHLRIDSEDLADNITTEQTIVPGSHAVVADYGLEGSAVEVSGYDVLVNLDAGACGASGTVDVKLQESEDDDTWSDVASGAFTQVTEANDNAIQEKAYTGLYRYIRVVATVGTAACSFGISVIKKAGPTVEDDLLNAFITAARQYAEGFQNRAYITQTYELWLDAFPTAGYIRLPNPPLQQIADPVSPVIKYYDINDIETEFSSDDYFVDIKSEPGWLVLNVGSSWPATTLRPANGVCIIFKAGYGDNQSDVPQKVKQAMLLLIGHYYENREQVITGVVPTQVPLGVDALLWQDRVF